MRSDTSVTVVTPVLNGRQTLPQLVASLAEQGVSIEWIVIDDGSSDGSKEYLESARMPLQVRLLVLTSDHAGPGGARNIGLRSAGTKWLTFVDADDRLEPLALGRWLQAANRLDADLLLLDQPDSVVGRMRARLGADERQVPSEEIWNGEVLRPWIVCSKIFRHDLVGDLAFPPGFEAEDLSFYVDAMLAAERVAYSPGQPRYIYDQPARSRLSLPLNQPQQTFDIYADILRRLAVAAPSRQHLLRGASPILSGLSVTLLRALGHANDSQQIATMQSSARAAYDVVSFHGPDVSRVYARDRSLVSLGAACSLAAPPVARALSRGWMWLRPWAGVARRALRPPL